MAAPIAAAVQQVVDDAVTQAGFELFALTGGGTRNRPLLEVRIDRPDGTKVTIEDCAAVSRAIEAVLDGSGLVAETYRLEVSSPGMDRPLRHAADGAREGGRLAAPMPGKVIALLVKAGDPVAQGQAVAVMEAMKMEHTLAAPHDGRVAELLYAVGDQVAEGAELLRLDPG